MVAHTPISAPRLSFTPSEAQSDQILTELADPSKSLLSVAHTHNTSPEALSLWLSRPEISERISSMRSSAALRTRWLATDRLPACAELSVRVVRAALANSELAAPDSALRAVRILLRLASFDPNARTRSTTGTQRSTSESTSPLPPDLEALLAQFDTPESPSDSFDQAETQPTDLQVDQSTQAEPAAETQAESSIRLPPGLLSSILPSFETSEHNPFHPDRSLHSTAPNQRTVVKLRLKQQRKQVIDEAVALLRSQGHCADPEIPAVRREIERFYLQEQPGSSLAARSPP